MSTVTLHTGTVALFGINSVDAPVLAGSGAVWDDGSDATYATVYTSYDSSISSSAFQTRSYGPLDMLVLPAGATATGITLHLRLASVVATPTPPLSLYLSICSGTGFFATDYYIFSTPAGLTGTAGDFAIAVAGGSVSGLASTLSAASQFVKVAVFDKGDFPTTYHYGVTTYEASVTVDYAVASTTLLATAPPSQLIAPLRQYPRTDGLGASSAPRLWPPPRSVQASNRRAGGYL